MRTTPINDTYCTLVSRGISGNSELSPRRMVVVQATGMKPTTQRKAQSLSPSRSSAPTAVSKFAAAGNSLTTAAEQFLHAVQAPMLPQRCSFCPRVVIQLHACRSMPRMHEAQVMLPASRECHVDTVRHQTFAGHCSLPAGLQSSQQ
jgi:hypothetical protein